MVESFSSVGRLSLELAKAQRLSGQDPAALVSAVCLYSSIHSSDFSSGKEVYITSGKIYVPSYFTIIICIGDSYQQG